MGVIQRQGFKESIVRYGAVLLGFVNTLFVYTYFLHERELGLIRFLQGTAMLLVPILLLGTTGIINRFFPHYRNVEKRHHGFLFLALVVPAAGFFLFFLLTFLFREDLLAYYAAKDILYGKYLHFILPICLFEVYRSVFTAYSGVQFRIVVPSLLNELGMKVGLPLLVIAYFFGFISFGQLILGMTALYGLVLLGVVFYVYRLGHLFVKPEWKAFTRERVQAMASYGVFAIFFSIGSVLAQRIDVFMVGTLIGTAGTAIYTLGAFVTVVIEVPQKSIEKIGIAVISEAWKRHDLREIASLYAKSCLTQLALGLWIFLGIWASIDELFEIIPRSEVYSQGKWVVLFLGLAKVIDMATGLNNQIVNLSPYYRFNFYALLMLGALNIGANLWLIPILGIDGVAIASLGALTLFNLAKFLFLKIKLGLQPFTWRNPAILLLGAAAYFLTSLLPDLPHPLLDIALQSLAVTLLFMGPLLWWRLCPDLNDLAGNAWSIVFPK